MYPVPQHKAVTGCEVGATSSVERERNGDVGTYGASERLAKILGFEEGLVCGYVRDGVQIDERMGCLEQCEVRRANQRVVNELPSHQAE